MAGNVWEWTDSWYKAYPGSKHQDDDYGEEYRVLRGGSWYYLRSSARCACRLRRFPDFRSDNFGFRLVSPI